MARLCIWMILGVVFGMAYADAPTEPPTVPTPYDGVSSLAGHGFLEECERLLADGPALLDDEAPNEFIQDFIAAVSNEIIGQEAAVNSFADVLELMQAFLHDPNRPMLRTLLVGPTGVGKTELVKAFIRFFGGNADIQLIRLDGGELQFDHEISRLIGTTAGYKGYGDKPQLHPDNVIGARLKFKLKDGTVIEFTILLFDELEKMSEAVFKLQLGILDNGKLTLADTTPSPMRKTMVIGTSNQGAKDVVNLIEARKIQIAVREAAGEVLTEKEKDLTGRVDEEFRQLILDTYLASIKKRWSPEYIARWQKIVQFLHLEKPQFLKISEVMLSKVQKVIFERPPVKFVFQVTPAAREWLVDQGTDFQNGSRELMNIIELKLTRRFARLLATEQVRTGDVILVDLGEGKLQFQKIAAGLDEQQMKQYADKVFPGKKMLKVQFKTGDQEVEDKLAVVRGLFVEAEKWPRALTGLWNEGGPKLKTENINASGTPEDGQAQSDTLTYKYITVKENESDPEGVVVRLYYSAREVQELKAKDPSGRAQVPIRAIVLPHGIPPSEQAEWPTSQLKAFRIHLVQQYIELAKRPE